MAKVITRLQIKNYRGVREQDVRVPAPGAIARGANGKGKTSILRAVRAALAAQDVGPDAIRNGADKAEILVDLDDVAVRRVITRKGTSLTVTNAQGFKATAPQTYLAELLGLSVLDPLDLFLAKPKDRRAKILEALPVTVTISQLRQWAPVPDGYSVAGHGLEVVDRCRREYYDQRTQANRVAATAQREAERLAGERDKIPAATAGIDPEAARKELDAARAALALLGERKAAAAGARGRQAAARQRIAGDLARAKAAREAANGLRREDEPRLRQVADALGAEVEALRAALAQKREEHAAACQCLNDAVSDNERAEGLVREAEALESSAQGAQQTLDVAADDVSAEDELRAAERVRAAEEAVSAARTTERRTAAVQLATDAAKAAHRARAEADRLDAIVRALTDAAPLALLGQQPAIPGLTLDGEDVLLDGVRIDALSGAEQMRFAVQVAKRLNAKAKLLVCDGLERLDPDQLEAFVREATADGWQLLGTRVDRGDVVIEGLAPDDAAPPSGPRAATGAAS